MADRCNHIIDRRFWSRCHGNTTSREPSRPPEQARPSVGGTDAETIRLDDIVAHLNAAQVRATDGAVAELVGGIAQSADATTRTRGHRDEPHCPTTRAIT